MRGLRMSHKKVSIDGKIMWEDSSKERVFNPDDRPKDLYGWHRVTVDGKRMWESSEGERVEK